MRTHADPRLRRLTFRAWRRGFREADLILGPFADAHLDGMGAEELEAFELLLDQPDQDLYGWIIGQADAPPEFDGPVLDLIRAFRFSVHVANAGAGG